MTSTCGCDLLGLLIVSLPQLAPLFAAAACNGMRDAVRREISRVYSQLLPLICKPQRLMILPKLFPSISQQNLEVSLLFKISWLKLSCPLSTSLAFLGLCCLFMLCLGSACEFYSLSNFFF